MEETLEGTVHTLRRLAYPLLRTKMGTGYLIKEATTLTKREWSILANRAAIGNRSFGDWSRAGIRATAPRLD